MEQKGPNYIPYEVWSSKTEKKRSSLSWIIGGATVIVVITIFAVLMAPILSRRAVISNLAQKFDEAKQIVTHENRLGPVGLSFDYRKIEESDRLRRIEMYGGNIMIFGTDLGGSKLDKKLKKLTTYPTANTQLTPLYYFRSALLRASANMQASVARSETRDGILYIRDGRDGRRVYAVKPLTGSGLATVDVYVASDRGQSLIARWRFERAAPDVSRFNPESFTRLEAQPSTDPLAGEPAAKFETAVGPARIARVDINERGDIFVGDFAKYDLAFAGKVNDKAVYSWAPSGVARAGNSETFREHLFYRQKGPAIDWPVKVDLEVWPVSVETAPRTKLHFSFQKPTCTEVPEYEMGEQATDVPFVRHRLRSLLYEAAIAESGDATLRVSTEVHPMQNPESVINFYRLALAFDQDLDLRAYRVTRTRLYYELYRAYNAGRQRQRAQASLLFARKIYRTDDPWLDEKIREGMIAEDLLEQ